MMTQRPFNMHVGIYTKTLCDDLRKGLLITLTLLFVCPGVWGQGTGTGTSEDPRLVSNETDLQTALNAGGHIKMTGDIGATTNNGFTIGNTINVEVTLDLNGYTLSNNYYTPSRTSVITIHSGSTVTIQDSNGSGVGRGIITGGDSQNSVKGGGIYNNGTLTFQSGKISGNNAYIAGGGGTYTGGGGAIYNESGATLTIEGGEIYNNRAHQVGGIYNAGTLHLNGGNIHDNGSNTTNNTTDGIHNTSGATLYISGAPRIVNNSNGNIYLPTDMKITIDGALTGNEGDIGIKMQTPGVFTQDLTNDAGSTYTNTDGWKYFKSDDGNYDPYFDDSETNEASLQRNWLVLGKLFSLGGTIKLTKDYTATATTDVCLTVPSETTLTLDLNGHTINRNLNSAATNGCAIWNRGQLTITDTSGGTEGVITGGKNSYAGGGIDNQGTLTIVKGRITGNSTSTNGGGINNQGTLNIQGGTITGNTATENGGGIYHNGTAVNSLNIQGAPNITSNTANLEPNNVYLLTGKVITIPAALTTGVIGVSMQTLGIFTSGLAMRGGLPNFSSDDARLTLSLSGSEAKLQSHWGMLQDQMMVNNADITLDRDYEPHPSDVGGLVVPSGNTVTLNMAGHTIDRKLTSASSDGYVIKNEGTLTITGYGVIKGGYNDGHGGGILNNYSLTLNNNTGGNTNSLDITGNKVTNGNLGAGIYQNGSATLLKMQGYLKINTDNVIKGSPDVASNVYLTTGRTITIDGLSASSKIKVTHSDTPFTFTSGFGWDGSGEIFSADNSGYGIGHSSGNEAIYGALLTITKNINITTGCSMTVKSNAVQGEVVPISISAGTYNNHSYVPVSLTYTPSGGVEQSISSYPKNGNYSITMPSANTEIKVVFGEGGYCGASGNVEKMKYYLNDGCLTFVTENNANCDMATYTSSTIPWKNLSYTSVNLSNHVTSISPYAFYGSGLTATPEIPASVATIGTKAFGNCTHLTGISVDGGNSAYKSESGVLFNKTGSELICYPAGKDIDGDNDSYIIPAGVTTIAEEAFAYNTHLTTIPTSSVTTVGNNAFKGCTHLSSVALTGVATIGETVFSGCTSLATLNITGDGSLIIPNNYFYNNTTLQTISLVDVVSIGSSAFRGCSHLTSLTINGTTTIGQQAFNQCTSLSTISLAGVTTIGNSAFNNCYTIPSITIPSSVTSIGDNAFCWCSGLTTFHIPESVTTFGAGVFMYCQHLESITVHDDNPNYTADDGILYNKSKSRLICYPLAKTGDTYYVPTTVTDFDSYVFLWQSTLKKIIFLHDNNTYSIPSSGGFMNDSQSYKAFVKKGLKSAYTTAWGDSYSDRIFELDLEQATIEITGEITEYDTYSDGVKYTDYDGNPKTPSVTVTLGGLPLKERDNPSDPYDYEITSYSNNTDIGTATVNITGHGDFAGTTGTKNFHITRKVFISGATGHYSTYYNSDAVPLTVPYGLQAYKVTGVDFGEGTTTIETINNLPAGTPVLLYASSGTCNGTYHLKKTTGDVPGDCSTNYRGVSVASNYSDLMTSNTAIYVLRGDKFYRAYSGTLPANRCYIAKPISPSPAPALLTIGFGGGDVTSINMIENENNDANGTDNWYTLDGRKLQSQPTKKGIYIRDGKKVIIK